MAERHLGVLLVEDSIDDAELISRILAGDGYALEIVRVDSEETLRQALVDHDYDVAITDHLLPGFDSEGVLLTLAELAPDLPCLLVSGKVGEEAVGAAMRQGAVDYVAKDTLADLPAAVERTLLESERRGERRQVTEALARSRDLFEAIFVNAHDAMLIADDQRRVVNANPAAAELLAMPPAQFVNLRIDDLMPVTSRLDRPRSWDEFFSAGERHGESDVLRADGALIATEYTLTANFLPGQHIMVMRDVRERRLAEAEAQRHTAQQEAIAAFGGRALREENLDLLKAAAATRVAATLGVEIASILELRAGEGAFVVRADHGPGRDRVGDRLRHAALVSSQASSTLREGDPVLVDDYEEETRFERDSVLGEREVRSALSVAIPGNPHPFGVLCAASRRPRAFKPGDATFLTAFANILADALRRAASEDEVRRRALHDSLTGLPNRTLLFDRLNLALARVGRNGTQLAVIFLDIDDFKSYNDTLGHRETDQLLVQVATRMQQTMRDADTVARFGGDEFVILCEHPAGEKETEVLTTRLASAFASPFSVVDDTVHKLSVSIGVATSDADNLDAEALLKHADMAMYRSKQSGRGVCTVATKEMRLAAVDRSKTKNALERAIENNELVLHYQPIVAVDTREIRAVEALVRWQHPERGLIPPGEFVPIAEESGLINRLGEWVLRAACRQAAQWRVEFGETAPLPIHVNLAARQVAQQDLLALVHDVVNEYGVPPSDIVLEITESSLIEGTRGPIAALVELKRMGVSIVLDDFGTGYSSLSYLERFPIDALKIDRAFVSKIEGPAVPSPIVAAIVGMAGALGVGTVAEGVETAEQATAVAVLGCQHAQGYFFARPAPAERITRFVRDNMPLPVRVA